ncbi:MAG TPA: hypothetical protein VGS22_06200 [Thermoanaerobaculia bacterium]|jgi:Tfp pilus tip-associated adhesin PilY1|nr:hypothetical protein [Thermoanaerobaculia bacterium]
MKHRVQRLSGRSRQVAATILLAGLSLALGRGRADDRLLLRQSPADPLMFILLDTSGSMAEQPSDSAVPIGSADDPASKMYQAKQSLYNALLNNPDVHYGFATFNQDQTLVRRKHWVYMAQASGAWGANPLSYPTVNVTYIFGGEDLGTNTPQQACNNPITVPTSGFVNQLRWHPRTGDVGNQGTVYFVRQSSRTYRTTTTIVGGNLGDATISVKVVRERNLTCNIVAGVPTGTYSPAEEQTVSFTLVRQALTALSGTSSTGQVFGAEDVPLGPETGAGTGVLESCAGMDPNTDSAVDRYRLSTSINPTYPANPKFDRGDFLPFDWTVTNRDEILRRLAPNLRGSETVPDFSEARYFQVQTSGGVATQNPPLVNAQQVPLLAQGFTPLGNSMNQFRDWYAGCHDDNGASSSCATPGWVDVAQVDDSLFGCRGKYLLILTDGLDTCGGNGELGPACEGARVLFEKYGVETFVIAFGQVSTAGNVLSCLASKGSGGTVQPFNPSDQTGLNNALESIFERVTQASRSFSSAAVPTVQANFEDTIYVPTFTPLNAASFIEPAATSRGAGATWDGHLNAFLKPIPINSATGKPDTTIPCTSTKRSGCFLWDAGVQLLTQAPTMAELNPVSPATPLWSIGAADNQRRLFYPAAATTSAVPVTRRLLLPQTTLATQQDLWEGMKLVADPLISSQVTAANLKVENAIKYTLQEKLANLDATQTVRFALGDIFHSNPVLVSAPSRIAYFDADVPNPPGTATACTTTNKGYRCFRTKHQFRRRLVAVGGNEGELHLFDAGIYRDNVSPPAFDNGTGKEALSFVPRPMLEHLRVQSEDTRQDWGVDGTIQVDDAFIDSSHNGTPTATEREWRTVLIGGLREGGSGYFALDVTQPDTFDGGGIPRPLSGSTYVPSCWNGGTGCGPVPFGSVLWSFADGSDEDGNLVPDLGDTWSTPNTGRIRIVTNALSDPKQYEDHYVAVFGGGMDPSQLNKTGNWLYMVDIETGKILYKRVLDGSAPSDPAAVDTDLDGYLDRIYIGTTKGWLYKVDMSKDVELVDIGGGVKRITSTAWAPFKVFDTATDRGGSGEEIRPIYFPPSVVFDSKSGSFAIGFGTGNREDLWSDPDKKAEALIEGRFYFLLDTGWHVLGASELPSINTTLPKTEADFVQITLDSALAGGGTNFLNAPPIGSQSGWIMRLAENERLISKSLTLSGIVVFTGFLPAIRPNAAGLCERNGTSNIYTVLATNGDAVLGSQPTDRRRVVLAFVTNPFVETNISKNPRGSDAPPPTGAVCRPSNEAVKTLRSLFPTDCKFTAYTQDIKTFQVDTELVCVAAIPVCVREQNWRDQ